MKCLYSLSLAILASVACPHVDIAHAGEGAQAAAAPFALADPARIAAGKLRFGSTCAAYCHGSEGEGGKSPSFKGRKDFSPGDTFKVITEGRRGTDVMPAWGNAFKPDEIWELVAYLQYLSTQSPSQ